MKPLQARPVTFSLLQSPQLLLREAGPTPRHPPRMPAPPERPHLRAPTANTTTQSHPGSSRPRRPTNQRFELWLQGPRRSLRCPAPLELPPGVPDSRPRKARPLRHSCLPSRVCSLSLSPALAGLIASRDKGGTGDADEGGDKQAVRKWLQVGGGKGRTHLPPGSSGKSRGRYPLPARSGRVRVRAPGGSFQNCAGIVLRTDPRECSDLGF